MNGEGLVAAVDGAHLNVVELLLSRGADVNGRDHDAVSETMSSVGFPRTDADVMSRIDQLLAHPERMNTTRELVLGSLPRSVRGEPHAVLMGRSNVNRRCQRIQRPLGLCGLIFCSS